MKRMTRNLSFFLKRNLLSFLKIMELQCKVQHYEWGKKGYSSKVAELCKNANKTVNIDDKLPYAELWMGTHVNGPSTLQSGDTLSSVIEKHPEFLGEKVIKTFGYQLPFLFKVLSINKALSIQAHPSKQHAEELHAKRPDIYKDPNHKPELAIALTPFEALCGFRPADEVKEYLKNVPELSNLIGWDLLNTLFTKNGDEFLKSTFKYVITSKPEAVKHALEGFFDRCKHLDSRQREAYLIDVIERLNSQFPNDVGCFMVYFLNYIKLQPSEAIYLGANEPHAYLSGDCMECMACSDNVVRAGLTPKYIDVETLCSMLNYNGEPPEEKLFKPVQEDIYIRMFKPPVLDFAVAEIKITLETESYKLPARESASILIVIKGDANVENMTLTKGRILFIPANTALDIKDIKEDLTMYQAFANI